MLIEAEWPSPSRRGFLPFTNLAPVRALCVNTPHRVLVTSTIVVQTFVNVRAALLVSSSKVEPNPFKSPMPSKPWGTILTFEAGAQINASDAGVTGLSLTLQFTNIF